ncbi:hypothetical protein HDK77DRAFT_453413 [Phyllosticta capitalensis]|uniref:Uncharacterized protein n=1 Tax=Phyllosticta capitalensis TaxID=121624 RepID=A0ABR1YQC8_9PEZI
MASLFNWFWGAFAKPDSRNETDNTAKQQQSESLPQTSRKRRLEDQDDGALEPNKKALLHRLEGSPLLESDLDDSLLNGHRYINPDVDFIDGHVNGRSDDPEDLPAKDYAESQLSDELFIKKEEELEYLHRAEPHWPVSDDDASDSIFATPERQTRDTILHDQLQSSVTKRLWLERHLADRAKETDLLRDQGFSADTISIHRRIGLRGIIPTFPRIWAYDLDTLAQKHFVDDPDPSAAFISSLSGNEFRAVKAFQRLMDIGPWARDAVANEAYASPNRKPAKLIRNEIEAYVKWAFKDGELDTSVTPPTIGVFSAPRGSDLKRFQQQVTSSLMAMKDAWREKLHDETLFQNYNFNKLVPEVYGIAIVNTQVRFVVLHDWWDEPTVVIWSEHDFASPDHDFWNAQALALMVVHCRNNMVDLEDILRFDPDAEVDAETSSAAF